MIWRREARGSRLTSAPGLFHEDVEKYRGRLSVMPVWQTPERRSIVSCPMCPAWMGGGMIAGTMIAVLLIVLLVVVIMKVTRS